VEKLNPRQGKVVELRFFGGLSVDDTAEVLKVSPETVMRDCRARVPDQARPWRPSMPERKLDRCVSWLLTH
jgi:DNA-directed RNA polymerase specialized sigma24 family protein